MANRRRVLQMLGVATLGGIAGCGGGSSGGGDAPADTPTSTPTETPTDVPAETAAETPTETPTDTPTETSTETATGEAGSLSQVTKLAADDGDGDDKFGDAIAVSDDGSLALLGAWRDEDPGGNTAGSAYVFSSSGGSWSQQTKLSAEDTDDTDYFGRSVDLSADGSVALVGAHGDEDPNGDFSGSAYVFSSSGGSWSQQAKLVAADGGDSGDWFGHSVALSDDGTTVVGAPRDEEPHGQKGGSAHVFTGAGDSWSHQARLVADDGDAKDQLGWSVGLSGDGTTAVAGASASGFAGDEDPNGDFSGSAYVFTESGGSWSQQTKLTPEDGDEDDHFANAVDLSTDGSLALLGAYWDEDASGGTGGSAYVFRRKGGSWSQQTKLAPEDGKKDALFGGTVALSGEGTTALVGAWQAPRGDELNVGSAYLFARSEGSWSQEGKMTAEDGDNGDYFGSGAGIAGDGTTPILGARNDEDPNGVRGGSAYVFER